MFGVALLLVSGAALAGATLIEFVAVGERRYLCRDPQRWVGDCEDGRYRTVSEGFGYRPDEGLRVGRGYFILPTPYDAELVCDFSREGDVSGDVTNIAWVQVSSGDLWAPADSRRGSAGGRRSRRSEGDVYGTEYRHSSVVRTKGNRSIYYIRDFTSEDLGKYRCFGTDSDDRAVYMEVDFTPRRLSGRKVTDIVFTAEKAF